MGHRLLLYATMFIFFSTRTVNPYQHSKKWIRETAYEGSYKCAYGGDPFDVKSQKECLADNNPHIAYSDSRVRVLMYIDGLLMCQECFDLDYMTAIGVDLEPQSIFFTLNPLPEESESVTEKMWHFSSWAFVTVSALVKVPQIYKICKNRSTKGISLWAYVLETLGYFVNALYQYRSGYPFKNYGEAVLVG
eukprot:747998_1